jgi:nitrate/nitrite transport system permease protein
VGAWQLATTGPSIGAASTGMTAEEIEYSKIMGKEFDAAKPEEYLKSFAISKAA